MQVTRKAIAPEEGIKVTTESGLAFLADPGTQYFGTIAGTEGSTAIVSVMGSELFIFLQDDSGQIYRLQNHLENADRFLLQPEINDGGDFQCGEPSEQLENKNNSNLRSVNACGPPDTLSCTGGSELLVYYELDHHFYLDENSDITSCVNFTMDAHAIVNYIYNNIQNVDNNQDSTCLFTQINSGGVNLLISGLHIWDHPDPYPMNLQSRLAAFQNMRPTFNGDIAHLLNKGANNDGGIASIDDTITSASLCDTLVPNPDYTPHSLSFMRTGTNINSPIYSYGTAIIAHEIGHTLGGRHTFAPHWYEDASGKRFSIENGNCSPRANTTCVMPGCTIEGTYEATIMSYCWGPTFGNVDYDNPFHREVATNILENLCNWQSTCYDPPQCPDNDLDGVCNAIDCAIDNPALPGIVGNSCSDGNPLTVNDTLVLDPDRDDNLSCTCQGTPWVNPAGAECDLIIGGMLDFDQDIVGTAEGTWYGGLNTGWTISPNNTPDIGHEDSPMDCNKFISFEGLYDHTNNIVSIKEGIAIELSHPIPCGVGRFQLSFNYSYVEKGGGLLTGNLVSVQGTNEFQNNMPHECNGTGGTFVCLGTVAPANQCDFNGTWGNLTRPADCTENITFCEVNEIITNQSDQDLNFIYLSLNRASFKG